MRNHSTFMGFGCNNIKFEQEVLLQKKHTDSPGGLRSIRASLSTSMGSSGERSGVGSVIFND